MKRVFIYLTVGIVLIIVGVVGGRVFQHAKSGYHYKVRAEKEFPSPMGPIHWSYVTESVGLPFLDPGTTVIKFEGRTIYKAQRGFQESVPFAQSIETSDKSITWNDGEFRFHLAVDRMKAAGQNGAVTGNQPKNAEVSSYISILQELQQFARDNRYNDSHPKLRTLINALLPATLSSEQLYRLGVSTSLIAYPQEAGADIPFDSVFAYASRRCAELLSVRADSSSAHYLRSMKPICGPDGGKSLMYLQLIERQEQVQKNARTK